MDNNEISDVTFNDIVKDFESNIITPDLEPVINNKIAVTSSGTAERFKNKYINTVLYVHELKQWFVWNSQYWKADNTNEIRQRIRDLAPDILEQIKAAKSDNERDIYFKEYKSVLDTRSIDNILKEAASL